jgi:hypothetical protein
MGFGLVIGFTGFLQTASAINCKRFTNLRTLQFNIAQTNFSQFAVFISRCLVTAPNIVDSSASVFTSIPTTDCLITPHGRNSLS